MANFLQRPSGALALIAAAVAGPYAAFETDVGVIARRVLSDVMGDSSSEPAGLASPVDYANYGGAQGIGGGLPLDPGHLDAPSLGYANYPPTAGMPAGQPSGAGIPAGHFVHSTNPPITESHRGPNNIVPGGTQQLWDYTLGVPSLDQLGAHPQQLGGGAVHDLREVLRFDIHPSWLPQRFSRVTTVLSNVQFDGLRVPLITGTKPSDLAGTLTYYFDPGQNLQRINLHALTGDPSSLAMLMTQFYGLQPEHSLGGQLYTSRWNNRVSSVLHVAPAPIIYAGADHSRYIVFLELNQTGANFALSEEAGSFLQNVQATQRW